MYDENQCALIDCSGTTDWFDVKSGEKKGCNTCTSGFLFLIMIDWIMRRTVPDNNTGIRWKLWSKLDDLDHAADSVLIFSTRGRIQQKVRSLNSISKETGLKINTSKTKLLRLNTASNEKIHSGGWVRH